MSNTGEFSIRRLRSVPAPDPTVPGYATRDPDGTIRLHVAGREYKISRELAQRLAQELADACR
jgi:hypothetical protein